MRTAGAIGFASLFTVSYADLVATPASSDPTITPAPEVPYELFRKQVDGRFMGWISANGNWTTRQCDVGGTLYRSKDYWRCCATTVASCDIPIGCVEGSLVYTFTSGTVDKRTIDCTDVYTDAADSSFTNCQTGLLYENSADSNPESNFFCGVSTTNWNYYRSEPAEAIAATQSPASSSASPSTTFSFPDNSLASATTAPTTSSSPQPGSESKAWIAGAVVGPVVGLALIGAAIFFLLRRRKNKKSPPAAGAAADAAPGAAPSYPGSPHQGYYQPMEQKPTDANFVPYGVGVNEQKHASAYYGPPSPGAQQGHSPGAPPYQQGYSQPLAHPTSPQMLSAGHDAHPNYSAPNSAQPQGNDMDITQAGSAQPHTNHLSSELEGSSYSPPNLSAGESSQHPAGR